jgi:thiamine transporter ThiT
MRARGCAGLLAVAGLERYSWCSPKVGRMSVSTMRWICSLVSGLCFYSEYSQSARSTQP